MRFTPKRLAASLTILAMLVWMVPAPVLASGGSARLEGLLTGMDGRPADSMTVHLIDQRGQDVARVATTDEGLYSFKDLPAGEYSLGIESAEGKMTPVAAPAAVGSNSG